MNSEMFRYRPEEIASRMSLEKEDLKKTFPRLFESPKQHLVPQEVYSEIQGELDRVLTKIKDNQIAGRTGPLLLGHHPEIKILYSIKEDLLEGKKEKAFYYFNKKLGEIQTLIEAIEKAPQKNQEKLEKLKTLRNHYITLIKKSLP